MSAYSIGLHADLMAANSDGQLAKLIGRGAEGWPYLTACAAAPTPSAKPAYLTVSDGQSPVGFAPCFVTTYEWLPARGGGKAWPNWMRKFGSLRLAAMGSTHSNELGVRLDPAAAVGERVNSFEALVEGLDRLGRAERAQMLLVKDVNDRDLPYADPVLRRAGYARMAAPPLAYLHLPMESADAYLAAFGSRKRKDILRNLKKASAVEVEIGADITGVVSELNALAAETRLRAGTQFNGLEGSSEDFFEALARAAKDNAIFTLFRVAGELIGFSLTLADETQLFGKTIGLSYPRARQHKVYFRNLIEAIDLTTGRGLDWLCLGQLGYESKLHFGAKLEKRWYYVKVRSASGSDLRLANRFVEGRRIETESARYAAPEYYFASRPDGPQPPAHLMFAEGKLN